MELPHRRPVDVIDNKGKAIEQLTQTEKQKFIADAVSERDKFVAWAKEQQSSTKSSFLESWKYASSKKSSLAALSAVGLANIGLAVSGSRLGLSSEAISNIHYSTFIAPIIEELIFRSTKIPHIIRSLGNAMNLPIRPDAARRITDTVDAFTHIPNWSFPQAILGSLIHGPSMQKTAHERGLAAAISAHALINANIELHHFLQQRKLPNESLIKSLSTLSVYGVGIARGIMGIKEIIDDKNIHDMLSEINQNNAIDPDKIQRMTQKMLSTPSTDGYKFQAGVELAYVNAALHMPDILRDDMTVDDYARTQVHKMVTEVWKDTKTLPHRLDKANRYITEQIARRPTQYQNIYNP